MRSLKAAALLSALLLGQFAFSASGDFPLGPNAQMTPGELCTHPDSYRYQEHIPYCTRNVASDLKNEIIKAYDQNLGFKIESMPRAQFKIDHYISLCMGGSNEKENLWPQHESVYTVTDPLEPAMCNKMAAGKLLQAKAVELMKQAKNDLSQVPTILKYVNGL